MFDGLYPDEYDQWGDEEPTNDIADYEEVDEGLLGEVSNYIEEAVEYDDFHGVEDILNSPDNDVDEFYTDDKNYMFIREATTDPFLSIFMASGKEKELEKYDKSEVLPSGVWGYHNNRQHTPLMKSIIGIMGCGLVVKLIRGEWNGLTRHPKDRGRNRQNSRTNSL